MTHCIDAIKVEKALASIRALAWKANSLASDEFDYAMQYAEAPQFSSRKQIGEAIESAFLHLLVLAESLGASCLVDVISTTYKNAKRVGLSSYDQFEDYHGWSRWSGPVEQFAEAIAAAYGEAPSPSEEPAAGLIALLEGTQAAITDKRCFAPPTSESEVHDRIELILKCVYPDLVRKPPLAKPVVNFIADSGIQSLGTLIEYKYLSQESQVGAIANQILADTRGYEDSRWRNIVFVIYETKRFRTKHEWQDLLRSCGNPDSLKVVVLHGEESQTPSVRRKAKKSANA